MASPDDLPASPEITAFLNSDRQLRTIFHQDILDVVFYIATTPRNKHFNPQLYHQILVRGFNLTPQLALQLLEILFFIFRIPLDKIRRDSGVLDWNARLWSIDNFLNYPHQDTIDQMPWSDEALALRNKSIFVQHTDNIAQT
jgi:hypothetical protein